MKKIALLLSAVISAGILLSGCGESPADNNGNTESVSEAETAVTEKETPAGITDGEITKLIEESNSIYLYSEIESLPFDQNDTSQWKERDYYKVTDERFDEWNEWVEYVRTVYVKNSLQEEFLLTQAHYINVDGFTYTDGGSMGCDILLDGYTYERIDPIDGRPACKVKYPDAFDETGEVFVPAVFVFEYTDDGWRIWDWTFE